MQKSPLHFRYTRSAGPPAQLLLTAIIVLFTCLSSLAQSMDKKTTASFPASTLVQRLKDVQQKTGITIAFDEKETGGFNVPPASFTNATVKEVIQRSLQTVPFSTKVVGGSVVVVANHKETIIIKKDTGKVSGRVVDFENGDPLVGATVSIEDQLYSTITDSLGFYELNNIPQGVFTLLISYAGYETSRIQNLRVEGSKPVVFDAKLQVKMTGNTAVVTAIKRKRVANTSDAQLVQELYNAKTVVSGISNEQIARTLDRDAAEVVKRVPGVNITDDNYVIVRGLNKRYNLTFLNDAMAPATDADSRSFSYDVISSNAIDRIMVYKSPSPDLPGEFSGGLVKIYTKKSQLTRQFDAQLSAQYRPQSTFENVWSYAGSKTDFVGFDDGTRSLPDGIPRASSFNHLTPAENARYSKQFKNIYVINKNYQAIPDLRFNTNYYDAWKIGGHYLKNLTSVSYTNTHEQRVAEQNSLYKYRGQSTQGIHAARLSAIQTNEMRFGDNLTVELRNFINANNQRIAIEDYRKLDDYTDQEFRHVNLYYLENLLYTGQLGSTFTFGQKQQHMLKAIVGYTTIHKQEPDNRDYTLGRTIKQAGGKDIPDEENPYALATDLISYYMLTRVFNDIKENNYQGNIDLSYRINSVWGFKTGYYHETRMRDFGNRTFILVNGVNLYDPNLAVEGSKLGSDNGAMVGIGNRVREKYLQQYFNESMFREDGTGYRWLEKTTPNNQYYADNVLHAGYLSTDVKLMNGRLNVFGGVRVEDNRFRILGSYERGLAAYPLEISQPINSVLPSVNISFRADSSLIIRAGYGKTLNRPEFREAAPMQYTNYVDQESYTGNPTLTTVDVHNTELRIEWYPHSARHNEMLNVGFFYKTLNKPIERIHMIFSEGFDQLAYVNTGKAYVYGMEAEIRKSFDFIPGKFFRNVAAIFNGSWFKSNVDVPSLPAFVGYNGPRSRRMQGQSPYLINASLSYEDAALGTKIALTYNRAGDYIYAVGANKGERADADLMMHARDQLDITWRQRINKMFSINAGVQNVFNAPVLLYQDWKNNYRYDQLTGKLPEQGLGNPYEASDVIYRRFHQRPYCSVAINMIF